MTKNFFLLSCIVAIFLISRLFRISDTPPSLYWDEASIGYNAYGLTYDLKDEWGEFLPLHFRAFGEFKLPVYVYAVAVVVKFFGLNEFSVRLPAVFFSLGTLVVTYFLALKIFRKETVALFTSFLLTVSPWFFIFSRAGYEVSAGLMFFLLGTYLFVFSLEKIRYLPFCVLSLIMSIYSYNSFRVIVPVFIILGVFYLILTYRGNFRKILIPFFLSVFLFLVSLIPILKLVALDTGLVRYGIVKAGGLFDILRNYFAHFSPEFMIFSGDKNLRSQQPGFGQIYLIDLPLIIFGIYQVIKSRNKLYWLTLLLFLIGMIPASLTRESPHALRSLPALPFLIVISSLGADSVSERLKKYKTFVYLFLIVVYLGFFEFYATNFFNKYPYEASSDWQYGYKALFLAYKDEFPKYKKVVISDEYGQPYIFALYYLKFNPSDFRKTAKYNNISNWGASTVRSFDSFEFKKVDVSDLGAETLVFATDKDKLEKKVASSEIRFLDGSTAFWVYKSIR